MPVVGIVITTHGAGDHLAAAVHSVLTQTFNDWRLVIVGDGSTSEAITAAAALAARDPRIQTTHQSQRGVAAARNRGIERLGTDVEFVTLLDHDDQWLPHSLNTLLAEIVKKGPECIGVHGIARFINLNGMLIRNGHLEKELRHRKAVDRGRVITSPVSDPTTFAHLAISNCIPVGAGLIRRTALSAAGSFDERAVPADDYDMWIRLSRIGHFAFVDEVILEYRLHSAPTWVRPTGRGRGGPFVREKMLTSPANTASQRLQARQGFRICARWVVVDALSQTVNFAMRGDGTRAAGQVIRGLAHLADYVLGRPAVWRGRASVDDHPIPATNDLFKTDHGEV